MKRLLLPLIALLCFYGSSVFVTFLPMSVIESDRVLVPHFLIIFILLMSVYYHNTTAILYAFIFGFLYDSFFTEVLGVYLFIFPFVTFVTSKIMTALNSNWIVTSLVILLNLSILELVVYQINLLIGKTDWAIETFADLRLWPTLILNAAFMIIVSYPLKQLLLKLEKERLED
ncbi:MAG: rod shape-determining protein MreD [Bacillota bacterium]